MPDSQLKGKPWSRYYLEAELVRDALHNVEKSLLAVLATTNDSTIARACNKALVEIRPAQRLAVAVFKDQSLKHATQEELLQEGTP